MNIYGSDPGFTAGPNGGTHTTWEDVALMRAIPHAVVCDAADEVQLDWIIREFACSFYWIQFYLSCIWNLFYTNYYFHLCFSYIYYFGLFIIFTVAKITG